jgi:hypothetical protein
MLYYMQQLQQRHAESAESITVTPSIVTSVTSWWASERCPKESYRFGEIKAAVGNCQDSELSAALIQLGWTKQRKWTTTGANLRVWVPRHGHEF